MKRWTKEITVSKMVDLKVGMKLDTPDRNLLMVANNGSSAFIVNDKKDVMIELIANHHGVATISTWQTGTHAARFQEYAGISSVNGKLQIKVEETKRVELKVGDTVKSSAGIEYVVKYIGEDGAVVTDCNGTTTTFGIWSFRTSFAGTSYDC